MIIGIDPGLKGAIAFLYNDGSLLIEDMPLKRIKKKNRVDGGKLFQIVKYNTALLTPPAITAAFEDVNAMPKDGVVSAFRFGLGTGILIGVLEAAGVDILPIKPDVWKPALGLSPDKSKSLALARQTFPQSLHYFKRSKDDGRAEAALLAKFALSALIT